MAIVKWRGRNPWWPSLIDDDFWNNWPSISDDTALSGMDIYETDDNVVVEAQVPGIQEENVKVTVEGNVLTISAETTEEEEEEEKKGKKTMYKSTCQKSFHYSTSLPRMVKADEAEAEVENGVVKITVPKTEEEKPKQIEVKKKSS